MKAGNINTPVCHLVLPSFVFCLFLFQFSENILLDHVNQCCLSELFASGTIKAPFFPPIVMETVGHRGGPPV